MSRISTCMIDRQRSKHSSWTVYLLLYDTKPRVWHALSQLPTLSHQNRMRALSQTIINRHCYFPQHTSSQPSHPVRLCAQLGFRVEWRISAQPGGCVVMGLRGSDGTCSVVGWLKGWGRGYVYLSETCQGGKAELTWIVKSAVQQPGMASPWVAH